MRLSIVTRHVRQSRWVQIEPGKEILVGRQNRRKHQRWAADRAAKHPELERFLLALGAGELEQRRFEKESESAEGPPHPSGVENGEKPRAVGAPAGAAVRAMQESGMGIMSFQALRQELEREEALELLEGWRNLVHDDDGAELPFSRELAAEVLAVEDLYQVGEDAKGEPKFEAFGDWLVQRILEEASAADRFLADWEERQAKNSEESSLSPAGGGDSSAEVPTESTSGSSTAN